MTILPLPSLCSVEGHSVHCHLLSLLGDFALGTQIATIMQSTCECTQVMAGDEPRLLLGKRVLAALGPRSLGDGSLCLQPNAARSRLCCSENQLPLPAPWLFQAHPDRFLPGWGLPRGSQPFGPKVSPCQESGARLGRTGGCSPHPPGCPGSRDEPQHPQAGLQTCVKGLPSPSRPRKWPRCPRHPDGSLGPD